MLVLTAFAEAVGGLGASERPRADGAVGGAGAHSAAEARERPDRDIIGPSGGSGGGVVIGGDGFECDGTGLHRCGWEVLENCDMTFGWIEKAELHGLFDEGKQGIRRGYALQCANEVVCVHEGVSDQAKEVLAATAFWTSIHPAERRLEDLLFAVGLKIVAFQ
jgi:hypothetical protein